MELEDPDKFWDWMVDNAVRFCSEAINFQLRRERQIVLRRANSRAFAIAVASGDPTELHAFQLHYSVDKNNLRRTVADMTGRDHLFVAESYSQTGNRALMLAEFHRAVARRVGTKRTSEVMDEAEYERMLGSIVNNRPKAA
jgi:hypothetical protein